MIDVLSQQVIAGDRRALARAITVVEDGGKEAAQLVSSVFSRSGRAHVIGVTGSPGVGKSTLVDALITEARKQDLKVAVLAVDPSSPFTGGAILGDRIRMQGHTLDRKVFIRSMANRGHQGGVSLATYDAVRMLDASGFDVIIIETVGVGQSELAIAQTADTTILVLMPGSGDDIQAIKSGIMEIGDVFVVNKGDLPGANKSASEIVASLELAHFETAWRPPVIVSIAETGQGIDELWQSVCDHKAFLEASGLLETRRSKRIQAELSEIVADMARRNLKDSLANSTDVQDVITQIINREIDPHTAASHLIPSLFASR
ncbi:MAG: methylmalonyl Co-A mutase-associated GTPase MeaB [Candidatus Obscuribacterales bacterium]|jgi:LAO/AO transport system kinase|nr:methylmalonyl Co-A mutase-associated GTPase MeaB [Candidatus Obscuribacterales bacterium]